jgi:hypothetical protein
VIRKIERQPKWSCAVMRSGGQEAEADILARGVEPDRSRALILGKPRRREPVAERECGRLEEADEEAKRHQNEEGACEALGQRREGPQPARGRVERPGPDPVDEPPAGNLEQGVGRAEGRQEHPQVHRVDPELARHARGGDPEVSPVEVVDRDRDEEHGGDAVPHPRR